MEDLDIAQMKELLQWGRFGKDVVELAKQYGFIPKKEKVKIRTVEKIRVVMRRPRRTKAEMQASRDAEQVAREAGPGIPEEAAGDLERLMGKE